MFSNVQPMIVCIFANERQKRTTNQPTDRTNERTNIQCLRNTTLIERDVNTSQACIVKFCIIFNDKMIQDDNVSSEACARDIFALNLFCALYWFGLWVHSHFPFALLCFESY